MPKSLSSIALYEHHNKLQLPFKSLEGEFKVTRTREVLQYRDSRDQKVAKPGFQARTGRKCKAEEAVQEAEARLRHRRLVGVVTQGRAGLGSFQAPHVNLSRRKKRNSFVQEEVRSCRAVGMKQQGAWTRWEKIDRKVTWMELWKAEPHRIKFLILSVYNVMPSPSNLHL